VISVGKVVEVTTAPRKKIGDPYPKIALVDEVPIDASQFVPSPITHAFTALESAHPPIRISGLCRIVRWLLRPIALQSELRPIGENGATRAPHPYCRPMDTSNAIKEALNSLIIELADPDSELPEWVSSSYAFEIDTAAGPLHLLFRLDNGDPSKPSIVALYLGGKLAADVPPDLAETMIRRLLDQAPWLVLDE
jgi:hypothetical protein